MKFHGNTILITGGGSGIGRGLAEAFHRLGNQVIIAGRRQDVLEQVAAAHPDIIARPVDLNDPAALVEFVRKLTAEHPALNVLINNAGIMRPENLKAMPASLPDSEAVITTNLLAPIRLIAALLPHLQTHPHAAILNVTSGLGFVPLPVTPTYSATKAALHSYTESLRVQLAGSNVEVIEIIPPAVATELTSGRKTDNPHFMPVDDYIAETMEILQQVPTPREICVKRVLPMRHAEATGQYANELARLSQFTLPSP